MTHVLINFSGLFCTQEAIESFTWIRHNRFSNEISTKRWEKLALMILWKNTVKLFSQRSDKKVPWCRHLMRIEIIMSTCSRMLFSFFVLSIEKSYKNTAWQNSGLGIYGLRKFYWSFINILAWTRGGVFKLPLGFILTEIL